MKEKKLDARTISLVNTIVQKAVKKDIDNAFPLIIEKSFSCIDWEKELEKEKLGIVVEDVEEYCEEIKDVLIEEILNKSKYILDSI